MNLAIQDGYSMTMNNYYETKPTTGCSSCLSHTASSFAGGKKMIEEAKKAAEELSFKPKIMMVTVLTS